MRGARLALLLLLGGAAGAQAQPDLSGAPALGCGRSSNTRACQELRGSINDGGAQQQPAARPVPRRASPRQPLGGAAEGAGYGVQEPPLRPDLDDIRGGRLVPPGIMRFLNDPRIDPVIRAYLLGMAGKKLEDWTVQDLQLLSSVVPALTELRIPTSVLVEFYEFLGLDPNNLFDPQLGASWQKRSTAFDPLNFATRSTDCVGISVQARIDPSSVKVQELLSCSGEK